MVTQSNIVSRGELISNKDWQEYIDSINDAVKKDLPIDDEGEAAKGIAQLFESAVKKRLVKKKFGIMFSGGVDSTLIAYTCKKLGADFVCYTVGIEGSKDLEESQKSAKELGFLHVHKTLTLEEAEELFQKTARILGSELLNIVNLEVGAVVVAAIELARKNNIDIFFSGLGSEEIFAGYQRHENASDINSECWAGLKSMHDRDFRRDYAIAKVTGSEFLTPFLDKDLIEYSMRINGNLKIKDDMKKYILRVAAENMGLPKDISFRPKSAAQYGSSFDKAIHRLTRKKGFKLKGQYIGYLMENL